MFKNKIIILSASLLLSLCSVGCSDDNNEDIQKLQAEIKRLEQTVEDLEQKPKQETKEQVDKKVETKKIEKKNSTICCDLCGSTMVQTKDKALIADQPVYECKNESCINNTLEIRLYCTEHKTYYYYCSNCESCNDEWMAKHPVKEDYITIEEPEEYCDCCGAVLNEYGECSDNCQVGICPYCLETLNEWEECPSCSEQDIPLDDYCPTCGATTNEYGRCSQDCQGE